MEEGVLLALVLDFLKFLIYCRIATLSRDFLHCCLDVLRFLFTRTDERATQVSNVEQCSPSCCKRVITEQDELTSEDIRVVIGKLGMIGWRNDKYEDYGSVDDALQLLEEKEASMEELKEAFYVFDRNEDGFITPAELWSVLRRLQFEEGATLEDCRRMIASFDEDGDGKISFSEFKSMLENAS